MSDITPKFDPRSGKPFKSLAQVLARYVVAPSGCWEWTGAKSPYGYAVVCVMIDGERRTMHASRLQWMRYRGKPAPSLYICHRCDVRHCINPEHLFIGTARDNCHDMISKGRAAPMRGENSSNARLTESQVRAIRADPRRPLKIAADYGVTKRNIALIKSGLRWRHVT